MSALLAAFIAFGPPAPPAEAFPPDRTAWIFSTVGQSEWCPAGNVRLDLRTGQYAFTATASPATCDEPGLERPVRTGTLDAGDLAAVRAAYSRAQMDGLEQPVCREGGRPERLIISNGGPHILLVASGAITMSAPDDLSCWSEAALALHDLLDEEFASDNR